MTYMPVVCTDRDQHDVEHIADYDPDTNAVRWITPPSFAAALAKVIRASTPGNDRERVTFPCPACPRTPDLHIDTLRAVALMLRDLGRDEIDIAYEHLWQTLLR